MVTGSDWHRETAALSDLAASYEALHRRDAAMDGAVFVALARNAEFFRSAAAAEPHAVPHIP